MEFFQALLENKFLQYALIASLLASFALGVTGTFVVSKRISGIAGGIAHAVLGGVGIAYFLGYSPVFGALVFAIFCAVLLGIIKIKGGEHENTIIAALWSSGMALGILFMYLTPGYNADLMTYLFGNILIVSGQEIYLLVGLNLLIAIVVIFFFRQLLAVSFDEEYAALRGIPAALLYILLLCLIALAIVVLMRLVGLILVIALLTLPPAIALLFTKRIFQVMGLAIIIGALFTLTGLWLAYKPDLPAGAMIVLVTGAGYVIAVIIKKGAALLRVFNK